MNRAQLAAWIPSYATATNISLGSRNISSIEASTFSNLSRLVRLELDRNLLSSLDPNTFNSLTNLQRLFEKIAWEKKLMLFKFISSFYLDIDTKMKREKQPKINNQFTVNSVKNSKKRWVSEWVSEWLSLVRSSIIAQCKKK